MNGGCWGAGETAQPKKILYVSAACLIDIDGRVLVQERPPHKHQGGKWEFPGGKVEAGEAPMNACVRELAEELAIETTHSCLAPLTFVQYDYDDFHLIMYVYVLRQWRGKIQSTNPIAWVNFAQLVALDMPPADKPIIPFLREVM